jgi:L-aspartate oxidase
MQRKVDFLIIGSGIAGISYALKVAAYGKVLMVTKSNADETNTKYAQGGIAGVMKFAGIDDNYEKHIQDTLNAGDYINDEAAVRIVVTEATDRINELITWGTSFDKDDQGKYDLAKEGGHSAHRILHHKDNTGWEIERALLQQAQNHPNIEIATHYYALDIITQHHLGEFVNSKTKNVQCYGAYMLNMHTQQTETILAKITLMASGGAGHVYESTTNPTIATGDGVAMVYRAKGKINGMEFVQFHPTSLYNPAEKPAYLISEAVRGFGAVLKTIDGEEFMHKYDERKSLAPRDIVARAIDNEMKTRGQDYVYLDCRHLDSVEFEKHFPNIRAKCASLGIDVTTQMIPVVPSAHYMCGGIKVNEHAQSSIQNLYAVGECSSTGLHGANRLASNSLLEALVYSHRAALHAATVINTVEYKTQLPDWNASRTASPEELVLLTQSKREVQTIMTNYVGIVRSNLRLKRAFDRLLIIHNEAELLYQKTTVSVQLCELRNLTKVAYLITKAAMQRHESVGLHYTIDYPKKQ